MPIEFRQLGVELREKLEQAIGIKPSEPFNLLYQASNACEMLYMLTTTLETDSEVLQSLDSENIKGIVDILKDVGDMMENL